MKHYKLAEEQELRRSRKKTNDYGAHIVNLESDPLMFQPTWENDQMYEKRSLSSPCGILKRIKIPKVSHSCAALDNVPSNLFEVSPFCTRPDSSAFCALAFANGEALDMDKSIIVFDIPISSNEYVLFFEFFELFLSKSERAVSLGDSLSSQFTVVGTHCFSVYFSMEPEREQTRLQSILAKSSKQVWGRFLSHNQCNSSIRFLSFHYLAWLQLWGAMASNTNLEFLMTIFGAVVKQDSSGIRNAIWNEALQVFQILLIQTLPDPSEYYTNLLQNQDVSLEMKLHVLLSALSLNSQLTNPKNLEMWDLVLHSIIPLCAIKGKLQSFSLIYQLISKFKWSVPSQVLLSYRELAMEYCEKEQGNFTLSCLFPGTPPAAQFVSLQFLDLLDRASVEKQKSFALRFLPTSLTNLSCNALRYIVSIVLRSSLQSLDFLNRLEVNSNVIKIYEELYYVYSRHFCEMIPQFISHVLKKASESIEIHFENCEKLCKLLHDLCANNIHCAETCILENIASYSKFLSSDLPVPLRLRALNILYLMLKRRTPLDMKLVPPQTDSLHPLPYFSQGSHDGTFDDSFRNAKNASFEDPGFDEEILLSMVVAESSYSEKVSNFASEFLLPVTLKSH
jgi:hypothetical protein